MAKKLGRPTKEMMLAVNAEIEGNSKEVNRLVQENKLDRKEIQQRIENREGEKYDLDAGKGPRKGRVIKSASASSDLLGSVDGRTKIATLLKLHTRIEEVLAQKPKQEVTKVKRAMEEVEELRAKLEEAEALIS